MQSGSLYGLILRKSLRLASTTHSSSCLRLYSAAASPLRTSRSFSAWPVHQLQQHQQHEVASSASSAAAAASILSPAIAAAATSRRQNLIQNNSQQQQQQQQQQNTSSPPSPLTNGLVPTPSLSPQYESDLIVVLDMDECLVHSKFFSPQSAKYAFQTTNGAPVTGEDCGISMVDTFHVTLPDGDWVKVHKRPFLQEFLQHTTQRYETHIFTAAMSVYAKPLLDRLEEKYDIQLPHRWYREHCVERNGMYIKDLGCLTHAPPERTVLVDNNPYSFLKNPSNGILVTSFYQDPQDNTLPVVADLLYELEQHEDVRPVLKNKFGLEQALRENGL